MHNEYRHEQLRVLRDAGQLTEADRAELVQYDKHCLVSQPMRSVTPDEDLPILPILDIGMSILDSMPSMPDSPSIPDSPSVDLGGSSDGFGGGGGGDSF